MCSARLLCGSQSHHYKLHHLERVVHAEAKTLAKLPSAGIESTLELWAVVGTLSSVPFEW